MLKPTRPSNSNSFSLQGWLHAIWEKFDSPQYMSQVGTLVSDTKVSEFEGRFNVDTNDDNWVVPTNVGGSITHLPDTGGVELSCGTTNGNILVRQTYSRYYYLPNKVTSASFGFQLNTQPGQVVECGLFDDNDGYLIRFVGDRVFFVRRYNYGTGVEEEVVESNRWNSNNSISDLNLMHMCVIEHAWYGGGCGNLKFRIKNDSILQHIFQGGGRLNSPIVGNPNLPLRFVVRNIADAVQPSKLSLWGIAVDYTGGRLPIGQPYSFPAIEKIVSNTSFTPILAIRTKLTVNGLPNTKSYISDILFSYYVIDRDTNILLIFNPTTLDGTWVGVGDLAEVNSTCTTYTGGQVVQGVSEPAGASNSLKPFKSNRLFTPASDLSTTDVLLVIAKARGGGANSYVSITPNWQEIK